MFIAFTFTKKPRLPPKFTVTANFTTTTPEIKIYTYISRTPFSCSSLCWDSNNNLLRTGSLATSTRSRTIFKTSCSCLGFFSFNFPSFVPPYLLKSSINLINWRGILNQACAVIRDLMEYRKGATYSRS